MKIIFIFQIALVMVFSGCSFNDLSESEIINNNFPETSVSEITEKVTETTQTATTSIIPISKVEKLNLGKIDKYSSELFSYKNKFIYSTIHGKYYPVEIGGRNSANYVLCLDRGNGNTEVLTETEDSTVMYSDEKSLYLSKYIWKDNKSVLYKLENDSITAIDEYPFECGKYNIGNYIYYSSRINDVIAIYRMDQSKSNSEAVIDLPENVEKYTIYDNKIWYDYKQGQGLSYYDLLTKKTVNFDKGKIGIINNGYMYYTYYEELGKLLRFNLSNYEYEEVCRTDKDNLYAFDFYDDYILYSSGNSLYRLSDNENTLIFSTNDYSEKYDRIDGLQCQDNCIFIKMGSGAFCQCIMEIDIDGNVIELIHED